MSNDPGAESKGRVGRLFASPLLNGWGFVIGVASLMFAFYAFWDQRSVPLLLSKVQPVRTVLISPEGVQSLELSANGQAIKGPVTAAQIIVWNAGKREVRAADILQPLRIEAAGAARLLSVRVLRMSGPVTELRVDDTLADKGSFELLFRILEQGDGGVIQVTYEGDDTVRFSASGTMVASASSL